MAKQERVVMLKLTESEVNLVGSALMELPAKYTHELIINLNQQVVSQLNPPPPEPKETGKDEE